MACTRPHLAEALCYHVIQSEPATALDRQCGRGRQQTQGKLVPAVGDAQTEARGLLRINAPVSFAIRHMAPLIGEFQMAHPAVGVDLQLNDRKVDLLEEGFDIALRIGHLPSSSLIAKRIASVRLVLCASPAYLAQHGTPEAPEELRAHRYLSYAYMEHDANAPLHRWLPADDRNGVAGLICNNGDVLAEAAIAGQGVVLQPTFIVGRAIREGKLRVVLPEYEAPPLGLYAVYAHRQFLASKVRCFIDFIEGYYGDPPYWDVFD